MSLWQGVTCVDLTQRASFRLILDVLLVLLTELVLFFSRNNMMRNKQNIDVDIVTWSVEVTSGLCCGRVSEIGPGRSRVLALELL